MITKYDDGLCEFISEGRAFVMLSNGNLSVTDFDEGGVYAEVVMELPEWLREAIKGAFKSKIKVEILKGE